MAHVLVVGGKINPISVDYNDLEKMSELLENAIRTFGPLQLAVAWIRSESRNTLYHLANFLNRTSPVCRLFHVCGTQWVEFLNTTDEVDIQISPLNRVYYRKILLGQFDENGNSRKLKRQEINSGIIEALSVDARTHIIGSLEPLAGQALSA